jgi:hypothetical protein
MDYVPLTSQSARQLVQVVTIVISIYHSSEKGNTSNVKDVN